MGGEDDEIAFDGISEVLGADVCLSDGSVERLGKDQLEQPLFPESSQRLAASAGQFLAEYFRQTETSPKDHVTPEMFAEAARSGTAVGKASLVVRIDTPTIKFKRGDELVNVDRLVFDLQLTVRKHLNS